MASAPMTERCGGRRHNRRHHRLVRRLDHRQGRRTSHRQDHPRRDDLRSHRSPLWPLLGGKHQVARRPRGHRVIRASPGRPGHRGRWRQFSTGCRRRQRSTWSPPLADDRPGPGPSAMRRGTLLPRPSSGRQPPHRPEAASPYLLYPLHAGVQGRWFYGAAGVSGTIWHDPVHRARQDQRSLR